LHLNFQKLNVPFQNETLHNALAVCSTTLKRQEDKGVLHPICSTTYQHHH
jgi:hypothetical protein